MSTHRDALVDDCLHASNLDALAGQVGTIELSLPESEIAGRGRLSFGTVRPRVQIPAARPINWTQIRVREPELGSNGRASRFSAVRKWISMAPAKGTWC